MVPIMTTLNPAKKRNYRNIGDNLKGNDRSLRHTANPSLARMPNLPFKQTVENTANLQPANNEEDGIRRGIQPAIQSMNDWSAMQKNIRAYPDRVKHRMLEIEEQFAVYRLAYTNILYKAVKVEDDIWGVYNNILDTIPRLEQRTRKRPLFL